MFLEKFCFLFSVVYLHSLTKVTAEFNQNTFKVLSSKQVKNNVTMLPARSLIDCADTCFKTENCSASTYDQGDKQCSISMESPPQLVDSSDDSMTTVLVDSTDEEPQVKSHFGTSFMTGAMCNSKCDTIHYNDGIPHLLIVSTSPLTTNVSVTIPSLDIYDEQHLLNGFLHLQYSNTLIPNTTNSVSLLGMEIVTDKPVALYLMNRDGDSTDGTLELPIETWGNVYIVDTYNHSLYGMGQMLVIATSDTTEVTIELPSGEKATLTLNNFETYEFLADNTTDLAGSIVTANNSIAVHVGHECANIPDDTVSYCDQMSTVIPPVSSLGRVFVVSYPSPRTNFSFGIAVPYDGTVISISDINGTEIEEISMNRQESIFRSIYSPTAISISSNENILVTQYGHGGEGIFGDPSLTVVPALRQFVNRCNFAIPPAIFISPIIVSVTIRAAYNLTELHLNGQPIVINESISILIPDEGFFNVVYIEVTSDETYLLYHMDPKVMYGAVLYCRNQYEEYSTVLGLHL